MAQSPSPRKTGSPATFLTWVWAAVLILGGGMFLGVSTGLIAPVVPVLLLLAGGIALLAVPFFARWLVSRSDHWAAVTAWVFFALSLLLVLISFNIPYDQVIASAALLAVAVPLLAVYFTNRSRWWLLIPAYTLIVLAGLLSMTILDITLETLGAVALVAAALPFWMIYLRSKLQWWAVIPAAVLTLGGLGLLTALTLLQPDSPSFYIVLNTVFGIATFVFWLRFRRYDWAFWLAMGFVLAAVFAVWFPSPVSLAVVALTLGFYIVFKQLAPAKKPAQPAAAPPASQPQVSPPAAAAPPPAASKPAAPVPSQTPRQGAQADAEATASSRARAEADSQSKPVVEFRPLDPFKTRREKDEPEDAD